MLYSKIKEEIEKTERELKNNIKIVKELETQKRSLLSGYNLKIIAEKSNDEQIEVLVVTEEQVKAINKAIQKEISITTQKIGELNMKIEDLKDNELENPALIK